MFTSSAALVFLWLAQVPDPNAGDLVASALKNERTTILDQEATHLSKLAATLAAEGRIDVATLVRQKLPSPPPRDGTIVFRPLPEVVPAPSGKPPSTPWPDAASKIEEETCKALFKLADEAATTHPGHYALAETCLRDILARQPNHPQARRLLGFEPYQGGWATPYAAGKLGAGMTFHEVYGWVKKSWVSHLEKGELPARGPNGASETWLPAAEADAQRREFARGWEISTEHFGIKTNVPLSEAIHFGHRLELLHELFEFLMADVIGEKLPLAARFKNPKLVREFGATPHIVWYFATRDEYVDAIGPLQGEEVATTTLGIYLPRPS